MAAATLATARSNTSTVAADVVWTPLILRMYWRAAASISSGVAIGDSPRNVVMLRHMPVIVDQFAAAGNDLGSVA